MHDETITLEQIEQAVRQTAREHDVQRVYLFGSHARGDATKTSDIDLCLETGPSFSLFDAGDFSLNIELLLGAPVDLVTEQTLYPHVREEMLKDRVLMYEHS